MLPRSHSIISRWVPSAGATGFRLKDRVGNNDGTLTNMVPASDWVTSGGRGALDFDGFNDHVLISPIQPRLYKLPLSISAWIFCRDNALGQVAVGFGNSASDTPLLQLNLRGDLAGDPICATMRGAAGVNSFASFSPYPINTWFHACGVFQSTTFRQIYVNGVAGTSDSTSHTEETFTQLAIGALARIGVIVHLNGQVDDVTLYRGALTQSEVATIYRFGRGYGVFDEPDFDGDYVAAGGFRPYWARRNSQIIGAGI